MIGLRMKHGAAVAALLSAASIAGAQTLDRSKPPVLGPPPKVALPPVVTRELPNGLKLMIVEQHELPLADFVLLVGSGAVRHPERPRVRQRKDALQGFNLRDDLVYVHTADC